VLFVIADAWRDGIVGINTVGGALVGAVTGFAISDVFGRAARRSSLILRFLESNSTLLIQDGEPVSHALFRASISLPELREIAHREGFADLGEIQTAILQRNGVVTLIGKSQRPSPTPRRRQLRRLAGPAPESARLRG
jgi:uncharacterized membrane protein YcaP (DUF421 family)